MKQILFIQGKTLLLLEYRSIEDSLVYGIYDNIYLGINGNWQGTCITKGYY